MYSIALQIKPLQLVRSRARNEEVKLFKFTPTDRSGSIPVSAWGPNTTTQLDTIESGTCVEVANGIKGTFDKKPTLNLNENNTTITVSITTGLP